MSHRDSRPTLVRPLLTERGARLQEDGQYLFEAALDATKADIKAAVEAMFKVDVRKVRSMIMFGKRRRFTRAVGMRPDWKKAIVTVAKGQKIDFAKPSAS
ncbi:MAG: 50S ribosomal protein L23 [Elusimicrobia bacterium]|nr:50S ribosomal protein L23 [Elusimicrobiota bacterium]